MLDVDKIRSDFPILGRKINGKKLVYFDNAATSQKPLQVINAISDFYKEHNANIHRGVHTLSQEASNMYDEGRENIAKFFGAEENEIIFTSNMTESLNLVVYSWGLDNLKEGDEVIISGMEHHSNIVPWHFLAEERRIKLKQIGLAEDYTFPIEELEEAISPKTKVVSVTHFSNVLGAVNPVKEIGKIAKDNGCIFVVDGAQSAPHMKIDVKDINCDFFTATAHKMLGPTGMGILYGRYDILENMRPFMGGGGMIAEVTLESSAYAKPPERFEAGTPNIAGVVGFSAAVDYLRSVGMENIEEHEREIVRFCLKEFENMGGIDMYGPSDVRQRGALFSFNVKGMNPHDVAMLLDEEGIAVRSGHHCALPLMKRLCVNGTVRASMYLYNTKDEAKTLFEALRAITA